MLEQYVAKGEKKMRTCCDRWQRARCDNWRPAINPSILPRHLSLHFSSASCVFALFLGILSSTLLSSIFLYAVTSTATSDDMAGHAPRTTAPASANTSAPANMNLDHNLQQQDTQLEPLGNGSWLQFQDSANKDLEFLIQLCMERQAKINDFMANIKKLIDELNSQFDIMYQRLEELAACVSEQKAPR